jgi:hypothetical protein
MCSLSPTMVAKFTDAEFPLTGDLSDAVPLKVQRNDSRKDQPK